MNAQDFVAHRVLPYSNQQVSTTVGADRRDKVHYFFNYEFEREPYTVSTTRRIRASTSTDVHAGSTSRWDVSIRSCRTRRG